MLAGVSKTAILTLRARADEQRRSDRFFTDLRAVDWLARIEWPKDLAHWYTPWSQVKTAIRAAQIDELVGALLAEMPDATVVELGCGFSTRSDRIAGGSRWIDLDLPEVIVLRSSLGLPERSEAIGRSVLDRSWFDAVRAGSPDRLVLIAEGLFQFLDRPQVDLLFADLRRELPGAVLIFDCVGAVDYLQLRAASLRAGAPVRWAVSSFTESMRGFGLAPIAGHEPELLLARTIDRFGLRYGPAFALLMRAVMSVRWIRERRSGLMAGRLTQI